MKLKTKITHVFNIEDDLLDEFDFSFEIEQEKLNKSKTKITEVKKKSKIKQDASTRLF